LIFEILLTFTVTSQLRPDYQKKKKEIPKIIIVFNNFKETESNKDSGVTVKSLAAEFKEYIVLRIVNDIHMNEFFFKNDTREFEHKKFGEDDPKK
jgi:hypothetical protein